jgi:hypothetical protein
MYEDIIYAMLLAFKTFEYKSLFLKSLIFSLNVSTKSTKNLKTGPLLGEEVVSKTKSKSNFDVYFEKKERYE